MILLWAAAGFGAVPRHQRVRHGDLGLEVVFPVCL